MHLVFDLHRAWRLQHPPHLSPEDLAAGIKSRRLLKGTLRCKRDDWSDCYLVVHSADKKAPRRAVHVSGRMRVNRALDGDVVAVELVDSERDEADAPSSVDDGTRGPVEAVAETAEPTIAAVEGLSEESSDSSKEKPLYGRVVGIVRRNWRQYAGVLEEEKTDDADATSFATFHPVANL